MPANSTAPWYESVIVVLRDEEKEFEKPPKVSKGAKVRQIQNGVARIVSVRRQQPLVLRRSGGEHVRIHQNLVGSIEFLPAARKQIHHISQKVHEHRDHHLVLLLRQNRRDHRGNLLHLNRPLAKPLQLKPLFLHDHSANVDRRREHQIDQKEEIAEQLHVFHRFVLAANGADAADDSHRVLRRRAGHQIHQKGHRGDHHVQQPFVRTHSLRIERQNAHRLLQFLHDRARQLVQNLQNGRVAVGNALDAVLRDAENLGLQRRAEENHRQLGRFVQKRVEFVQINVEFVVRRGEDGLDRVGVAGLHEAVDSKVVLRSKHCAVQTAVFWKIRSISILV